ncbi:MAG: hypothetical protein JSR91_01485 [Proteobacteria bacterium]|nr:hypothetical protein [Pseudomonadota bacterium]
MMLGVVLAGFAGVMDGVCRMAVRRVGMVRCRLMGIGLMMPGCFAMMLGRVLMMLGRMVVMLDDLLLGHGDLHRQTAPPVIDGQERELYGKAVAGM